MSHLFSAVLQFTSDSPDDAVVPPDGRLGDYLGSGRGDVVGERIRGTMRWSVYSGNCLYPRIRRGEAVPDDLHLCTLDPDGFIDTHDGACVSFDGKGYGLRSPERYRVGVTLTFKAEDPRYTWLNALLASMEGEFDERSGRASWNVYAPMP